MHMDLTFSAIKLIQNYLSKRKQRTKINSSHGESLKITFGVPQGSLLGPFLCNIFLADLYLTVDDIETASYADDNPPYLSAKYIEEVIKSLEEASKILSEWLLDNLMKSNANKCHLLISTSNKVNIKIGNFDISNSKCEKRLGVKFDPKLTFD